MKRLLPLLLLSGCGFTDQSTDQSTDHRNTTTTVSGPVCSKKSDYGQYTNYVTEFKDLVERATNVRPSDYISSITWSETAEDTRILAVCNTWYDNNGNIINATIVISPILAGKGVVLERIVILHELGHCIMNDRHTESTDDLMYPYMSIKISEAQANARIEHYMVRLSEGE